MGTEFYEITKYDIKYRDFLKFIRYRVYELCNEADVILYVGPEKNFYLLYYLITDYSSIRKKFIDLGRLWSPRKNGNLNRKYLSYVFLQTNIKVKIIHL